MLPEFPELLVQFSDRILHVADRIKNFFFIHAFHPVIVVTLFKRLKVNEYTGFPLIL